MLVEIYEGREVLESHNDIHRVEIELEDGQRFSFRKRDHLLSVSTDGQLLVIPRATNAIQLEAAD